MGSRSVKDELTWVIWGPHVAVTALSHSGTRSSPATKRLVSSWQLRVKLLVLRWPEKAEGQMYRLAKADRKAARSVPSLNATNVFKGRTTLHWAQSHSPAASSAGTGRPCSQDPSHRPNQEYKFTSLPCFYLSQHPTGCFRECHFQPPSALWGWLILLLEMRALVFLFAQKGKFLINNKTTILCACVLWFVWINAKDDKHKQSTWLV